MKLIFDEPLALVEDLRKPEVREKLWSMYNDHITNNAHKQLLETKRLQSIDKKLKQYKKVGSASPFTTVHQTATAHQQRSTIMRHFSERAQSNESSAAARKGRFLIEIPNESK